MMRANGRKVRMTGVTRLLFVLLALTVAVSSLSVPAVAADRVVGNPNGEQTPPAHGVNAVPEGAGSSTDLKVEVIDTMSRYAVDLEIDTSALTISAPDQMVWDVNALEYVHSDQSANIWYAHHQINIKITNYSDKAIMVDGTVTQNYQDCGYTLSGFATQMVGGAFHGHETQAGVKVEMSTSFVLSIASWDNMVSALREKGAPDYCTLGTITVSVRPSYIN